MSESLQVRPFSRGQGRCMRVGDVTWRVSALSKMSANEGRLGQTRNGSSERITAKVNAPGRWMGAVLVSIACMPWARKGTRSRALAVQPESRPAARF